MHRWGSTLLLFNSSVILSSQLKVDPDWSSACNTPDNSQIMKKMTRHNGRFTKKNKTCQYRVWISCKVSRKLRCLRLWLLRATSWISLQLSRVIWNVRKFTSLIKTMVLCSSAKGLWFFKYHESVWNYSPKRDWVRDSELLSCSSRALNWLSMKKTSQLINKLDRHAKHRFSLTSPPTCMFFWWKENQRTPRKPTWTRGNPGTLDLCTAK